MLINTDKDGKMPVMEKHTCNYHKLNPMTPYPGCTCSTAYGTRAATPEERADNKRRRLEAEKANLKKRLSEIESELPPNIKAEPPPVSGGEAQKKLSNE